MVVLCWLIKVKLTGTGSHRALFGGTENVEVLNGALLMTQNVAEQVGRLRSKTGRFPWSFPSLNLNRSQSSGHSLVGD